MAGIGFLILSLAAPHTPYPAESVVVSYGSPHLASSLKISLKPAGMHIANDVVAQVAQGWETA